MIKRIEEESFKTRRINSASKWRLSRPPKYKDWFDKDCHYLSALYSSLVHYKPKYCLEIGTHKGDNSTLIFEKYFENHMPDGHLVTLDIVPCKGLNKNKITQVLVQPHHKRIYETCGGKNGSWFSKDTSFLSIDENDIVEHNVRTIQEAMSKLSIDNFDFCFLDGDHERESFLGDLETCLKVSSKGSPIMIDDTKEEIHPCCHIFQEEIKPSGKYHVYDFEDWNQTVGCSIIREKV